MGPFPACCHYAVATCIGVLTRASLRGSIFSAVRALALLRSPSVRWAGAAWAVAIVGEAVQSSTVPPLVTSSFPIPVEEGALREGTPASSIDEETESALFHRISYADCAFPLVVGGEIVRCEGGPASDNAASYPLSGPADSLGPLLNQFFSMEVSTDVLHRQSVSGGQRTERVIASASVPQAPSDDTGEAKGEEKSANTTSTQEKEAVSMNPHFIRIFGRWMPYSRGPHLWLDPDVTTSPLRRLSAEPAAASESEQNGPPGMSVHLRQGLSVSGTHAAAIMPKRRYPFLYWRHSALSLSVQHLCIALIKLPTGEASSLDRKVPTAEIPGSCEEAQQLLPSEGSLQSPFWLSCGPQLELSRLTHFLTFSISQEKVDQLLAALEYSVDIWSEPRETKSQSGRKGSPQEATRPNERTYAEQSANNTAQKDASSVSAAAKPEHLQARDVEARRLAARQEEPVAAPSKWRVGVCLLTGSQEGVKSLIADGSENLGKPQDVAQNGVGSGSEGDVLAGNKDSDKQDTETGGEGPATEAKGTGETPKTRGDTDATLVGEIRFHVSPTVISHGEDDDKKREPETIQIRHFIDAGWMYTREIRGVNLTRFNRLALKESLEGLARPCMGFWEEHSLLSVAPETYARDETTNQEKLRFVCALTCLEISSHACKVDWHISRHKVGIGGMLAKGNTLQFNFTVANSAGLDLNVIIWVGNLYPGVCLWFSNYLKNSVQSREALYNSVPGRHATSRMQVCFYPNDEEPYGLFLGEVQFVIDSADATLLVFFILFVFLAIPVTCAVAISFHVYKHRHLRERLQRLALVQQRDAVEQLLMRELGLNAEDQDDADDDDDDEETHA